MPVIVIVADGARPDTLKAAIAAGHLPALQQLSEEGSFQTIATAWPSVTGVAYTPFLLGRFPGAVGIPGLRWFDRSRTIRTFVGNSRSYVGAEMWHVDEDLDPKSPTAFELIPNSLAALSVISRGLPKRQRLGFGLPFAARAGLTHFRGNVRGWLDIDRHIANQLVERIRTTDPEFVFAAFTGIDKTSHSEGHDSGVVLDAMRIIDDVVARIRSDAERSGRWKDTHIWIVSDHGHSPVRFHDDVAVRLRGNGYRVLAHPWIMGRGHDVAVMVSGNAMCHLYFDLSERQRPFWPQLSSRWSECLDAVMGHESVDLAIIPTSKNHCKVIRPQAGAADLFWDSDSYSYAPLTADPLGIGEVRNAGRDAAFAATVESDYPDALVQIAELASCDRSGDVVLSASREWDFRERYEPIPHLSSHGALHRDHMLVPLITSAPTARLATRTTDVLPSALAALGRKTTARFDGTSFV